MYQGKFDKTNKQTSVDVHELVAQRNNDQSKKAAVRTEPAAKKEAAPAKAPVKKEAPKAQAAAKKAEAPAKNKGPRLGGVIFYTLYFLFIFLFFVATFIGLNWLQDWLVQYEAAQPTAKSQQVFEALFDDPDWGALYRSAGIESTQYEDEEAFVTYMENKVGDSELTFVETSAGLSLNTTKYIVKLGGEKIATFTMVSETAHATDIPDWKLGTVELFYERNESFRIQSQEGHKVSVNGVELTDDHTIQITGIKGGDGSFLPVGASLPKSCIQQIDGLMAVPTVTVKDAAGKDVSVSYDEETRTFVAQTASNTISEEDKDMALSAIKTYAQFGINEASTGTLSKYFDPNGEAYANITATDRTWTKGNNGYSFANDTVSGYGRYSDSMFSVYVTTEMTIKLIDGGTQTKDINATLLFSKASGSWKVIRMTNADISQPQGQVRITFMHDDVVLSSEFYASDASELTVPTVSAPEGKVFGGWVRRDGNEWTLVFPPEEDGTVTIPNGTTLEPMTLYALFENPSNAE